MSLMPFLATLGQPASGGTFTDNFATPASASNWTELYAGATGVITWNTGNVTLTPAADKAGAVAILHTGSYRMFQVTLDVATNGGVADYMHVCIGQGTTLAPLNGATGYWHSAVPNGYAFYYNTGGQWFLDRMDAAGTASTNLSNTSSGPATDSGTHTLLISIDAGVITGSVDGVTVLTGNDTTYADGNVAFTQGEYTNGNGAAPSLTQAIATP